MPYGIFPTQESNLFLLRFLYWQVGSLPLVPLGKPNSVLMANEVFPSPLEDAAPDDFISIGLIQ